MINSSEPYVFHVFSRDDVGTSSVKKLRKQGKVVGSVYGLGAASQNVFMDKQAIIKLYSTQGDTGLIYLQIGDSKKQVPVLITDYQTDTFGTKVLNVSFRRVDLTDPIEAEIPVVMVGEADIRESVITLVKDSIEVEALPADLPDKFEIDISSLTEIGQMITLADIKYDKSKITLVLDEDENPSEIPLVVVQAIAGEVPEEETPETEVGTEETQEPVEGAESSGEVSPDANKPSSEDQKQS